MDFRFLIVKEKSTGMKLQIPDIPIEKNNQNTWKKQSYSSFVLSFKLFCIRFVYCFILILFNSSKIK